ncbi:hypothetical protein BJF79_48225 [Actinomadura sp. CNU-125]|uniref:hypothetical protein n=1 Tax=Actinomadura sp. CNU-125 TaxID=1904961 RepID=UPI00095DF188|nr:hypothetical protein [Actinomadura sp. CNU-125]OLT18288.1 hypothetical protein BJF79_48225 [Actinomadura sp. CNU-125]
MNGDIDRAAFARVGLRPGRRPSTGPPDTAVKILGRTWAAPIAGPDGALLVAETTDTPVQILRGFPDEPALEAGTVEFVQVGTPAGARAGGRGGRGRADRRRGRRDRRTRRAAARRGRRRAPLPDPARRRAELGADVLAALALGAPTRSSSTAPPTPPGSSRNCAPPWRSRAPRRSPTWTTRASGSSRPRRPPRTGPAPTCT